MVKPTGAEKEAARQLLGLTREYGISVDDVRRMLEEQQGHLSVPVTVFSNALLSPLEALTKYLHEERGLKFVQIAAIVGRDQRNVATTYRRVAEKMPEPLVVLPSPHRFPLSLLQDRTLSVFEHVVAYLLARGLKQSEIAQLTLRDQRTIWTIAYRMEKKRGARRK